MIENNLEERFCYFHGLFHTLVCILTRFNHEKFLKLEKKFPKDTILQCRLLKEN